MTTTLVPFANYTLRLRALSDQAAEGIKITEELKDSDLSELAGSSYRVLVNDCGYRGREIIDQMFSEKEQDILNSCYGTSDSGSRTYYLSGSADLVDFDISSYKTITFVEGSETASEISSIKLSANDQLLITADLSEFVKDIEEYGSKKTDSSYDDSYNLNECAPIELDEHYDLKIAWFNAEYNVESKKIESLSLDGYLLEK